MEARATAIDPTGQVRKARTVISTATMATIVHARMIIDSSHLGLDRHNRDVTNKDDPVSVWRALPRRIYLDTSTLQNLYRYGEVIWEDQPFEPIGRAARVEGLADELEALRRIFLVNQREGIEFVVTEANLREVEAWDRPSYTQWVHDVLDTWLIQSSGQGPPERTEAFDHRRSDNISAKDRRLLQDALDLGCDAFMTMERRRVAVGVVTITRTRSRLGA
jgi:hypothetical protein